MKRLGQYFFISFAAFFSTGAHAALDPAIVEKWSNIGDPNGTYEYTGGGALGDEVVAETERFALISQSAGTSCSTGHHYLADKKLKTYAVVDANTCDDRKFVAELKGNVLYFKNGTKVTAKYSLPLKAEKPSKEGAVVAATSKLPPPCEQVASLFDSCTFELIELLEARAPSRADEFRQEFAHMAEEWNADKPEKFWIKSQSFRQYFSMMKQVLGPFAAEKGSPKSAEEIEIGIHNMCVDMTLPVTLRMTTLAGQMQMLGASAPKCRTLLSTVKEFPPRRPPVSPSQPSAVKKEDTPPQASVVEEPKPSTEGKEDAL